MTDKTPRHASPREIADLNDGLLTGARFERVAAHLAVGCASCDAARATHARLVGAISAGVLPAAPARVLRRAQALFGSARRSAIAERVREIVATLVLDQQVALAPALRGSPGDTRRILWTIGDVEIVVGVTLRGGRADVLGEVLGADGVPPQSVVRLLAAGGDSRDCACDAEGAFAARDVRPGTYVLTGELAGAAFRTPPFVIG